MKMKDSLVAGLISGIVLPPLAFYLFCLINYPGEALSEIINRYYLRNVLTHVISLSVITNLALFFILLHANKERAAKGVIGATFIFVFIVLVLKFP